MMPGQLGFERETTITIEHANAIARMGGIECDLRFRTIHRDGVKTELTPRVCALLQVFLTEPQRLHSRESLLNRVWNGVVVEDANLSQSIWILRKALGDEDRQLIRTVAKSGYVFEPQPSLVWIQPESLERATNQETGFAATSLISANASSIDASSGDSVQEEHSPLSHAADSKDDTKAAMESESSRGGEPPQFIRSEAKIKSRGSWWIPALLIAVVLFGAWWFTQPTPALAPQDRPWLTVMISPAKRDAETRALLALAREQLQWQWGDGERHRLVRGPENLAEPGQRREVIWIEPGASKAMQGELIGRWSRDGKTLREWRVHGSADDWRAWLARWAQSSGDARASNETAVVDGAHEALRGLGRGLDAIDRHQPTEALHWLRAAHQAAPHSGLIALRLAQIEYELGHLADARRHVQPARAWLQTLRPTQKTPWEAELLELEQRHEAAAEAFAALAKSEPDEPLHGMGEIRNWLRARRVDRAMPLLQAMANRMQQGQWPLETKLAWWMTQANHLPLLGQFEPALQASRQAQALAKDQGWQHAFARARHIEANILAFTHADPAAVKSAFEEAIESFRTQGDEMGALRSELLGEAMQSAGTTLHAPKRFESLLEKAVATGNHALQIEALTLQASIALRQGDVANHAKWLEQAGTVAAATGDRLAMRLVQTELAMQDLMADRMPKAQARLEMVLSQPLEGLEAFMVMNRLFSVYLQRAEYEKAADILRRSEITLNQAGESELMAALHCQQASLALATGARPEATQAVAACAAKSQGPLQAYAKVSQAILAIQNNELDAAKTTLNAAADSLKALPAGPAQANLQLALADAWWRAGEVDTAKNQFKQAQIQSKGFPLFQHWASVGLAECAFEANDLAAAKAQLNALSDAAIEGNWSVQFRRDLLRWQLQGKSRDGQAIEQLIRAAKQQGDAFAIDHALHAALEWPSNRSEAQHATWRQELLRHRERHGVQRVRATRLQIK